MIIEKAGAPITSLLKEENPFKQEGCAFSNSECKMDPKSDCSDTGLVYQIKCDQCDTVVEMKNVNSHEERTSASYLGMTATSAHNRLMSHREYQATRNMKGPMARHDKEGHNRQKMSYTTTVVKREKKLLSLCITKALYIEK